MVHQCSQILFDGLVVGLFLLQFFAIFETFLSQLLIGVPRDRPDLTIPVFGLWPWLEIAFHACSVSLQMLQSIINRYAGFLYQDIPVPSCLKSSVPSIFLKAYQKGSQTVFIISIIIIRMGNSSKNAEDYDIVRNYRSEEWQLAQTGSSQQLWKNRKTHELAEIYRLYAIPSIEDMNRYEMRSTQENFVKVCHIALSPNQALCFNQQYVRVLIEYIPVRLGNVGGLELQEALTVLSAVFKGFNAISNNFGLVEPQEELIGFNQWGKTKVWLNKQHNNNFPPQQLLSNHMDKSRVQASHVRKLFDLIERKTENGQLPIMLKEQFRMNNPGYLQAVLIVEQFAYKNLLSLQRFIRTDLYARKANVHSTANSNSGQTIRHLRGMSNEKSNTQIITQGQNFARPQLKRIQSVDALHAQRPLNHSQSTVQFARPFKQNINHLSAVQQGHFPVKSSIPRIQFQRSSQSGIFMPFLNQPVLANNANPIQVRSRFYKERPQHIKCVSILAPQSESPSIEKIDHQAIQPKNPSQVEPPPFVAQQINYPHPKFEEKEQAIEIRIQQSVPSFEVVQQPRIESNIDISHLQPAAQGEQTCRSIIDKVESEMADEEDVPQSANVQYQYHDEQIQVSGTFNYKALYERDNAEHFSQPLEQIGQEDFSKERQDESKIKDPEQQYESQFQNRKGQSKQDDQIQNIPINFQSFAPAKLLQNQLMSFAPNQASFPTQQSIQTEQNVQTSKSFEYDQNERNRQKDAVGVSSFEQLEPKGHKGIYENDNHHAQSKPEPQNYRDMAHILEEKKRVSINLIYAQGGQNPFYTQYTPVESKFDVVVRRDSNLSQESQRHERPSAFAHLDTDEEIQNYVRNKYLIGKDNFHEKVKVGRVESQYEKHYVKEPEVHENTKKKNAKDPVQRQSNRSQLRPHVQNKISNIVQKPQEDFLDVNFLEKSLDKRYSANIKDVFKKRQEEDALNIAKLDEGLMKFSTSKASLTQKSSKDERYFDPVQPKVDYKSQYYKWEISTGFEYQAKPKQPAQLGQKKKKKSVKIDHTPTHQFVYQLSSSDYGNFKGFTKQSPKSPYKQKSPPSYQSKASYQQPSKSYTASKPGKISQSQKQSLDDRYNKYVKNGNKPAKLPKTPSINQILGGKGDSRLMLSPIPEKRFEDDGRLSYDQLRSFLWG